VAKATKQPSLAAAIQVGCGGEWLGGAAALKAAARLAATGRPPPPPGAQAQAHCLAVAVLGPVVQGLLGIGYAAVCIVYREAESSGSGRSLVLAERRGAADKKRGEPTTDDRRLTSGTYWPRALSGRRPAP
jgi:hypothetical protein